MKRRAIAIAGLTATLALIAAAVAIAATVKAGTYTGTLKGRAITITFRVPKGAKKVTAIKISDVPLYCSGGGPPIPISFRTATISKHGTFSSKGTYFIKAGPRKGQVGARLALTGSFGKTGHESGKLTTTWVGVPHSCSGASKYTTTPK